MSTEITTAFVEQYKANVLHLAQQKGSRLRMCVRNESQQGKNQFFERMGKSAAVKRTSRHADTPQIDTPHSRRRVSLVTYDWADMIDQPDKVRMLINPESDYAMVGANAMGRSMDDEIIAAANGNAYSGETGSTTVALPAGQKVAVGTTGLTLAKLLSAKEILDANEVDPDDRYVVASAKQFTDLLNTTEIKNADYNTVKALVQGQIDTFLGFKFIRSQRLGTVTTGVRAVLAFQKNALLMSIGNEPTGKISERADKNYSTQVFFSMDIGATRLEDEGVVEIACQE